MTSMADNMDALFKGKAKEVVTDKDKERGPDIFFTPKTGQVSKLVFLGWLDGGQYADQPVFYSPLLKRAIALPAHTILLDKLSDVPKMSPVILTCERAASGRGGAAARYTLQAFPPVSDDDHLSLLRDALREFMGTVEKIRGNRGVKRTEAGPGLVDVEADF